jgi:hypothetical protein
VRSTAPAGPAHRRRSRWCPSGSTGAKEQPGWQPAALLATNGAMTDNPSPAAPW